MWIALVHNIEYNTYNTNNDSNDTKRYLHDYKSFIRTGNLFFGICLCRKDILDEKSIGEHKSQDEFTECSCKLDQPKNPAIGK
jgi:hypothetical protein